MQLLIFTDNSLAERFRDALDQNAFVIEEAKEIGDAEERLTSGRYDLVVLDQGRLWKPCPSLISRWRQQGLTAGLLVLLPQDSGTIDRAACLDAGADVFMIHPPDLAELGARLRALGRRQCRKTSAVRRVRDLEIDLHSRSVKRGGQAIELTPREFSLLEFLARSPGRSVSREKILKHLYGEEDRTSNVVDAYVGYLRKKLDEGFGEQLILTNWGQGYLLRGEFGMET